MRSRVSYAVLGLDPWLSLQTKLLLILALSLSVWSLVLALKVQSLEMLVVCSIELVNDILCCFIARLVLYSVSVLM